MCREESDACCQCTALPLEPVQLDSNQLSPMVGLCTYRGLQAGAAYVTLDAAAQALGLDSILYVRPSLVSAVSLPCRLDHCIGVDADGASAVSQQVSEAACAECSQLGFDALSAHCRVHCQFWHRRGGQHHLFCPVCLPGALCSSRCKIVQPSLGCQDDRMSTLPLRAADSLSL